MRSKLRFTGWYIRFCLFNFLLITSKFFGGLLGLAWFVCLFPRAVWKFKNKGL